MIEIRSGFKKHSIKKPILIASRSIIQKLQAIIGPAPYPLPSHTKVPCSLLHLTKSKFAFANVPIPTNISAHMCGAYQTQKNLTGKIESTTTSTLLLWCWITCAHSHLQLCALLSGDVGLSCLSNCCQVNFQILKHFHHQHTCWWSRKRMMHTLFHTTHLQRSSLPHCPIIDTNYESASASVVPRVLPTQLNSPISWSSLSSQERSKHASSAGNNTRTPISSKDMGKVVSKGTAACTT